MFLVLGVAHQSEAQAPLIELSGGYQYMADIQAEETFTNGLYGSAAWNVTGWLAAIGEFTYSQKTVERLDATVYTTMGGVRFGGGGGLFGQVLFGQLAVRTTEEKILGTLEQTMTETAIQPGVGYDIGITDTVAVRVMGDYRQVLSDREDLGQQFRVAVGAVVGFGGR